MYNVPINDLDIFVFEEKDIPPGLLEMDYQSICIKIRLNISILDLFVLTS